MFDIEALHLACAFELKVPDRCRVEVQQLISLINEQLWVGHFDLWTQDGLVMYRHALVLAGGVDASSRPMRGAARNRARQPASGISRLSSSWSGPARVPARRSTPPCSRPRARPSPPRPASRCVSATARAGLQSRFAESSEHSALEHPLSWTTTSENRHDPPGPQRPRRPVGNHPAGRRRQDGQRHAGGLARRSGSMRPEDRGDRAAAFERDHRAAARGLRLNPAPARSARSPPW